MAWSKESASSRGYGSAWNKLRTIVMMRDFQICQPCTRNNRVTLATEVDHIIPKAKGGTDDLSNLQAICEDCHKKKTNKDKGFKFKQPIGKDGWPIED